MLNSFFLTSFSATKNEEKKMKKKMLLTLNRSCRNTRNTSRIIVLQQSKENRSSEVYVLPSVDVQATLCSLDKITN